MALTKRASEYAEIRRKVNRFRERQAERFQKGQRVQLRGEPCTPGVVLARKGIVVSVLFDGTADPVLVFGTRIEHERD